jgi:hypothetical protein
MANTGWEPKGMEIANLFHKDAAAMQGLENGACHVRGLEKG